MGIYHACVHVVNGTHGIYRRKRDKDNFIQKAFKVCKVFKMKPLKIPKPDVPSKKTAYNLFRKDIRKIKKELQGVPVSKASAIISKKKKKS